MIGEALRVVVAGGAVAAAISTLSPHEAASPAGSADVGFGRPRRVSAASDVLDVGASYGYEIIAGRVWRSPRRSQPLVTDCRVFPPDADVPTAEDVVAIAGEDLWICALGVNGGVDCWSLRPEQDDFESPHDTERSPRHIPIPPAHAIAVSGSEACALVDERAFCWAAPGRGVEIAPTEVATHVRAVSVSHDQRCLAIDNAVECVNAWATPDPSVTRYVGRASQIAGDSDATCALVDKRVWCWHRLGEAHEIEIPDAVAIDVREEACALTTNGDRYCWGWRR